MRFGIVALAGAVFLAEAVPLRDAGAQGFPFSQRGSVAQTVAFTNISISYGRPVARSRVLFGQLVPWDSVWHPGADSATVIALDQDLLVEGRPLSAGEYSLWLVPRPTGAWTLIFSRAARVFHRPYPGPESDALRLDVMPDSASHMETMAFYFPLVLRDEAVMRLHWGTTFVAVRLKAPYRPSARPGNIGAGTPNYGRTVTVADQRSNAPRRPSDQSAWNRPSAAAAHPK